MPSALAPALALLAIGGHFALIVYVYNRLHALAWPRWAMKLAERALLATACGLAVIYLIGEVAWFAAVYGAIGWLAAALVLPCWLVPKLRERLPRALVSNDTTHIDVAQQLGAAPVRGARARWLARFPGNQLLQIAIQRKTLCLDTLPRELDGLTIAHLSDLHMTGRLDRPFYDVIVEQTNALAPDLIVITGDILERQQCLPWIKPTLGRLRARHGKFFILGNHELKLGNVQALRDALFEAGLVDLGERFTEIAITNTSILLAGNERPWFGTGQIQNSECRMQNAESSTEPGSHFEFCILNSAFRLLLSHTPDQLPWARRHNFDLMLAGHNHGGQIRLPYLGALITPSRYGSRFAGGLYDQSPTMLHVTRGLCSAIPIRLNCPPELPLLILRAADASAGEAAAAG